LKQLDGHSCAIVERKVEMRSLPVSSWEYASYEQSPPPFTCKAVVNFIQYNHASVWSRVCDRSYSECWGNCELLSAVESPESWGRNRCVLV
jgi:hypothetical protein